MIETIPMEDWLRGCVHHDGRHGYVTLPCDEVLKIADFIEKLRADRKTENSSEKPNNSTISILEQVEPQTEQWHYDEKDNTWYPYQHKSCSTCKHALGNWDGESNNCGRCCGADRRFYEPIEDEQTKRSE